jgi:hypothetical protein
MISPCPETGTAAIGVGNAPLDCIITPCMTLDEFIENLIRVRNDRNGDRKATVVMPDLLPLTAIFNKGDHIISDLDPDEE